MTIGAMMNMMMRATNSIRISKNDAITDAVNIMVIAMASVGSMAPADILR